MLSPHRLVFEKSSSCKHCGEPAADRYIPIKHFPLYHANRYLASKSRLILWKMQFYQLLFLLYISECGNVRRLFHTNVPSKVTSSTRPFSENFVRFPNENAPSCAANLKRDNMKREKSVVTSLAHTRFPMISLHFPSSGIFMHAFYSPVPAKTVHTVPKISFQSSGKVQSRM